MVSARSSATAPISIASATSAISSPAPTPVTPAPRTRRVSGSTSSLVVPSVRPMPSARPDAAHGKRGLVVRACRRAWPASRSARSRRPRDRCRRRTGSSAASKRHVVAGDHLGGDHALVRRLVREHRLADDVADREDVRDVGALLLVDRDEAALADRRRRPRRRRCRRRWGDGRRRPGCGRRPRPPTCRSRPSGRRVTASIAPCPSRMRCVAAARCACAAA